jgi:hypothetical protein
MPGPSAHLASKTDSSSYPMRKRIHFFRMGGARPLQRLAHSIAHVTHRAFIWPVDISFSRTLSLSLECESLCLVPRPHAVPHAAGDGLRCDPRLRSGIILLATRDGPSGPTEQAVLAVVRLVAVKIAPSEPQRAWLDPSPPLVPIGKCRSRTTQSRQAEGLHERAARS